jgi:hypothetical protein
MLNVKCLQDSRWPHQGLPLVALKTGVYPQRTIGVPQIFLI